MIEVRMKDKELILNFVNQYDRLFNAELIAKLTSVSIEEDLCVIPKCPAFQDLLCSYPQFFHNFST